MSKPENSFSDILEAIRFIALNVKIYGIFKGRLSENYDDNRFLAFFSKDFLRARQWSIIPLWEGDLRVLQKNDRTKIYFLNEIRDFCLRNNDGFMYVAALEKNKWEYSIGFESLVVAARKLDLSVDDPNDLFKVTPNNLPYWGNNFMWPSSERFVVYTEGDNCSFIAGDRREIEDLIGLSYSYCRGRFISAVAAHGAELDFVDAYAKFCDEFV
ncbi:MAG: hypothetical protein LBV61_00585 [Burkholderiaceae bacterium]|jgi:hypothetical protein|nr:hypothetical protein [Burkholderiaceae bacterium]